MDASKDHPQTVKKKLKSKVKVTIEMTNDGYSAYADDINVVTTAISIVELYANLIEAINLYYEDEGKYVDSSNLKL